MHHRSPLAALSLPFLAVVAPAQIDAQLAGLSRTNAMLRFQAAGCAALNVGCATGLPGTVDPWAGGTGYDAQSGEFWVSDGAVLARVQPRGCTVSCGPWPAPVGFGAVTGLDVLESSNHLLVLDSTGVLTTLSLSSSCNGPVIVSSCNTGLPRNGSRSTSGLAADEILGLVFYNYTDFATGTNQLLVAQSGAVCAPFHRGPLPQCLANPFGSVRGLAVDSCRHVLFATDGHVLLAVPYQFDPAGPSIAFGALRCCPSIGTVADPLVGLALRPSPGEPVGQSCANGACRPCPMHHTLLTGPVAGNPNLLLHLEDAQDNTLTWLVLGAGPCMPVGPSVPPLCGPLLVNPSLRPLVAGPFPVSGGAFSCGASATVVLAIPNDPSFCGTDWSTQFLSLCTGPIAPGWGVAMSNCLSWTILGA
jgi:hypothetical protein